MLFNSFEFLIFFPTVILLYFMLPYRRRWILLLIASYYFYMSWNPTYILLIMASTIVDYFVSLRMSRQKVRKKRLKFLWLSLAANLGILFSFKYFDFFAGSLNGLADAIGWNYSVDLLDLVLPVGISFYTFQTLSYTIDVFNGKVKPERHFGIFALYVAFFPQLVAGPIERPRHLLPQFKKHFDFDLERVKYGLTYMLWGLFKKVVIADRISNIIDPIYASPGDFSGLTLAAATILFSFQIFCDFSGYSDIAIGSAKVMGFDLMKNFDRPYFAKSIAEFWRRWHISLSTWFRDYVYIPLGGNRTVKWRWYYNLFITFLISGLWHGAAWTFVIWGALHGFFMVFGVATAKFRLKFKERIGLIAGGPLDKLWTAFVTFTLVNISWVFFRANTFTDVVTIFKNILNTTAAEIAEFTRIESIAANLDIPVRELLVTGFVIFVMELIHFARRNPKLYSNFNSRPALVRWPAYYVLILMILLLGVFDAQEFIYFQF